MTDLHELLELERRFWTGGADVYDAHLAADCVMVFPGVGVLRRDQILRGVCSASRWRTVTIASPRVVTVADGVLLVAYRARAERDGQPPYETWATSTYVETEDGLRLAAHQQSPA